MHAPGPPHSDLIALVDLPTGQAEQVAEALSDMGLRFEGRTLEIARDGGWHQHGVRIFVLRDQVRDARAIVFGVLPELRPAGYGTEAGGARGPQGSAGTGSAGSRPPTADKAESDRPTAADTGTDPFENLDHDEEFRRIVAGLRAEGFGSLADAVPETPEGPGATGALPAPPHDPAGAGDDRAGPDGPRPVGAGAAGVAPRFRTNEAVGQGAAHGHGHPDTLDELDPDEHFVPPEPPPFPRIHRRTWGAWIAIIAGAVMTGVSVRGDGPSLSLLLLGGLALFFGGVAAVIARARPERDMDDDGAIV